MTATRATKPAFCPFIYHDGETLFLEFEGQVLRFTYTEAGLHKALKHVPNVSRQPGFLTGRSNILSKVLPKIRVATRTKTKRTILNVSQSVRNAASELIRKKLG